jgi:hypothetical protein
VEFVSWPIMETHRIYFRNGYPEAYYDFPALTLLEWYVYLCMVNGGSLGDTVHEEYSCQSVILQSFLLILCRKFSII